MNPQTVHFPIDKRHPTALAALLLLASFSPFKALGQAFASASLPDAPAPSGAEPTPLYFPVADTAATGGVGTASRTSDPLDKVVLPGESAPRLTVFDKSLLGIKHTVSPFSAAGWVLAASYQQAFDQGPNYGQTGKGYAQRIGAAAAKNVSEGVFSDSIMANVLREDPRYYKLGPTHNAAKRFFYAGTRVLVTRTDGGASTVNFSLLSGNLAGSALTQAYYPSVNRGFTEVFKTFGASLGGAALGFEFSEFIADPLEVLHLRSRQ